MQKPFTYDKPSKDIIIQADNEIYLMQRQIILFKIKKFNKTFHDIETSSNNLFKHVYITN